MRAFSFLLLGLIAWPLRAESFSLHDALRLAREHSPEPAIARQRVEAAQAWIDQAQSAWLPWLSLSGRYTDTNNSMVAFGSILNQRAFDFSLDFNHPGRVNNLNGTGTLAYNIYSGGQASARRLAARAGAEAANLELEITQRDLATEVVRTGLQVLKANEAIVATEAGVKAYEEAVRLARLRYEAGQMLKADLLSLEVKLAQTREMLLQARQGAALAARFFRYTLGLPSSAESVELDPQDPVLQHLQEPAPTVAAQRAEQVGLQARLRAAEAVSEAHEGAKRPQVNAFASYQYDRGPRSDRHADAWVAGVAVELNVFDGGLTRGRVRESRAQVAEVRALLHKVELGLQLEVEQARLALTAARERIAVNQLAAAQAEESAQLSRARFQNQALLAGELIAVEARLLEARLHLTFAVADERLALVQLRRALGLELF